MISQNECKHEKTTKHGKHMYADGYHQIHRCTICAKIIKGKVIIKPAGPIKNMQVQNQPSAKIGDSHE